MGDGTYTFPGPGLVALDRIESTQAGMLVVLERLALTSELEALRYTIDHVERAIGSRLSTDHRLSVRRREIEQALWPTK